MSLDKDFKNKFSSFIESIINEADEKESPVVYTPLSKDSFSNSKEQLAVTAYNKFKEELKKAIKDGKFEEIIKQKIEQLEKTDSLRQLVQLGQKLEREKNKEYMANPNGVSKDDKEFLSAFLQNRLGAYSVYLRYINKKISEEEKANKPEKKVITKKDKLKDLLYTKEEIKKHPELIQENIKFFRRFMKELKYTSIGKALTIWEEEDEKSHLERVKKIAESFGLKVDGKKTADIVMDIKKKFLENTGGAEGNKKISTELQSKEWGTEEAKKKMSNVKQDIEKNRSGASESSATLIARAAIDPEIIKTYDTYSKLSDEAWKILTKNENEINDSDIERVKQILSEYISKSGGILATTGEQSFLKGLKHDAKELEPGEEQLPKKFEKDFLDLKNYAANVDKLSSMKVTESNKKAFIKNVRDFIQDFQEDILRMWKVDKSVGFDGLVKRIKKSKKVKKDKSEVKLGKVSKDVEQELVKLRQGSDKNNQEDVEKDKEQAVKVAKDTKKRLVGDLLPIKKKMLIKKYGKEAVSKMSDDVINTTVSDKAAQKYEEKSMSKMNESTLKSTIKKYLID